MTRSRQSPEERDRILREAFAKLKARGVSSAWAASQNPYSEIEVECRVLMGNADFQQSLATYLRTQARAFAADRCVFTDAGWAFALIAVHPAKSKIVQKM